MSQDKLWNLIIIVNLSLLIILKNSMKIDIRIAAILIKTIHIIKRFIHPPPI